MALYLQQLIALNTNKNHRFSLVLSGGNTPRQLYALLASEGFRHKFDWDKVDFFFSDERHVPQDDQDSNFKMANDVMLDPLGIKSSQIFAVNTVLSPEKSAADYWKTIRGYIGYEPVQFDLVLLGLGDNAHTASLFPHTAVLHERQPGVKAVVIDKQKPMRITFTAPLINEANHIAFLVTGSDKAPAVQAVLEGEKNIEEFPAQLIRAGADWFLDANAASQLRGLNTNR
jgi:6-phosphogluconolactonase